MDTTDMEHATDSAEQCGESIMNKKSGAGANAASAAEMVLCTNSPLSELIWTPQEGLCLKYTYTNKGENKASFLWKEESCNMITSTSQRAIVGECITNRDHIVGHSTVKLNVDSNENADTVAFVDSLARSIDPHSNSLTRLHRQDSRAYEDIKFAKDEADLKLNHSVKSGGDPYSHENSGCFYTGFPAKNVVDNIQKGIFFPGHSCELPDAKTGFAITGGTSNENLMEKYRISEDKESDSMGISASLDSVSVKSEKSISSVRSAECKHIVSALDDIEDDNINKLSNLNCFVLHNSQVSSSFQPKKVGHQGKDGFSLALFCQDVGNDETHCGNTNNEINEFITQPAYKIGKLEKGKEKVFFDDEGYCSSTEKENDNDSVESSINRRLTLKGKRSSTFDLKISERCKRIKRENNLTAGSGSPIRKNSSFFNWISTITSRLSSCAEAASSLALLPLSYNSMKENFGSVRISHEKSRGVLCKSVSFSSFFQTLYCSNIIVPKILTDNDPHRGGANHSKKTQVMSKRYNCRGNHVSGNFLQFRLKKQPAQRERIYNSLNERHLTCKPSSVSSLRIVCGGNTENLHNQVSPSKKSNYVTNRAKDCPSMMINISSSSSKFCGKLKQNTGQVSTSKSTDSSSSLAKKDFICTREIANGNASLCESLWITRFLQKASSPIDSLKCNLTTEGNDTIRKELNFKEDNVSSYLKCLNPNFPCGSSNRDNQLLEPRITPVTASEDHKRTDLSSSCSAKRCDPDPCKASFERTMSCSPITCLFCGKWGHNLRQCSEVAESDRLDFQKVIDSYKGKTVSSCFCIRCFQGNHWAISCPSSYLRIKNTKTGTFSIAHESCNMIEKKPDCSNSDYVEQDKQDVNKYELPGGGVLRKDAQTLIPRSFNVDRIPSSTASVIEYRGENMVDMKPKTSSSSENESRGNQIIPLYKHSVSDVTNDQNVIFEAVRKLRLSRTNLMRRDLVMSYGRLGDKWINLPRWMKSTNTSYSIEGFFLRLRLGKWDKGLGGTGYQVARIVSASRGNCLSVSIGNTKCSLECCFVSNHDYVEEELKAWMSATLEADGKLPCIKELNKKLEEREELGL